MISAPVDLCAPCGRQPDAALGSWLSEGLHKLFNDKVTAPPSQADVDAALAKAQAQAGTPAAVAVPSIGGVPLPQVIMLGGFAIAALIITHRKPR